MGCGACANICPADCIQMMEGTNGFLEPVIDRSKCIQCGKCIQTCPENNSALNANEMKKAYFFVNKDIYNRNLSSSGGFVKAVSDYIVGEKKGVCYGAAFAEDLSVHHVEVDDPEEIYGILGSKYVQSNTEKTFSAVKRQLKRGRYVLYIGTPCQISGLKSYLNNIECKKLVTIDIFCHGVPSPDLWRRYLEEYFCDEIIRYVQFRDKTEGWWKFKFRVQMEHSEYASYYRSPTDDFLKLFLKNISLNKCCYDCRYRSRQKQSDFYIGDAWNINKVKKNMDDNRGITTVITNTSKAEMIMDEMKKHHHVFEISLEEGAYSRTELFEEKTIPKEREEFMNNYMDGIRKEVIRLNI